MAMEAALVDKINQYAHRGTLLLPRQVHELAEAVCGEKLGVNWASTFTRRHRDQISSRFWAYQELGRVKADTPATKKAFYDLVSFLDALSLKLTRLQVKGTYDTGLYPPPASITWMRPVSSSYPLERHARLVPFIHPTKLSLSLPRINILL
jgi:hypothetical protein